MKDRSIMKGGVVTEVEDSERPWWHQSEYDWGDDLYYETLADYFQQRYEELKKKFGFTEEY